MLVELDRVDILNLVKFTAPSFDQQQTEEMMGLGRYSDVFNVWIWNDELDNMSNEELFSLYKKCKK